MPNYEKGNNSVKYWQNFMNSYSGHHIMYPNCMPGITILTQMFSRYFVHKVALLYKMAKSKKRDSSTKYLQNFAKS